MEAEKKVTLQELQDVLKTMNLHNRENGYIAVDSKGVLKFYDAMPSFGGAYVTKQDIISYINNY
jgi:hypothetical protein